MKNNNENQLPMTIKVFPKGLTFNELLKVEALENTFLFETDNSYFLIKTDE